MEAARGGGRGIAAAPSGERPGAQPRGRRPNARVPAPAPRRRVLPAVRGAQNRSAAATQTAGAHSGASAEPGAMPRAVGAGARGPAGRGGPRALSFLPGSARVGASRRTAALRPVPARGRRALLRGSGARAARPAGRREERGGRTAGAQEAGSGARPPRGHSLAGAGAPCRTQAPAAGGARGKPGAGTWGRGCAPGRASRASPPDAWTPRGALARDEGASGRTSPGLPAPQGRPGQWASSCWRGGVGPGAWSQVGNSGPPRPVRRCSVPELAAREEGKRGRAGARPSRGAAGPRTRRRPPGPS